jgi:hypothetical protein
MLMNSNQLLNPVYEYSVDGINWLTSIPIARQQSEFVKGQWYWQDVASPQAAQYYRVRETSGGTLDVVELVFSTPANEIILSQINKDDYQNLPFKNQMGRPLQFWFDRQITPQMWVWPASMYSFNSLVVWRRRELQDVGSLTNILEFPNYALDYVLSSLALRMIMILPGADISRVPLLQNQQAVAKQLFWTECRPTGNLSINPMIGCYTRGSGRRGY